MYKQISKDEFIAIMKQLTNEAIWVRVFTDTINIDILYPRFEFLEFKRNLYQFGHSEYNIENEHQNIIICFDDVMEIHRDTSSIFDDTEHIVLTMYDDTNISIGID